jgi:hypothetical protein
MVQSESYLEAHPPMHANLKMQQDDWSRRKLVDLLSAYKASHATQTRCIDILITTLESDMVRKAQRRSRVG